MYITQGCKSRPAYWGDGENSIRLEGIPLQHGSTDQVGSWDKSSRNHFSPAGRAKVSSGSVCFARAILL